MKIEKFITGTPKAQPRVKAYSRGGRAGVYDPGTANEWKNQIKVEMKNHANLMIDAPISVQLQFLMPRPKSHFGTGKNAENLKLSAPYCHTKKPDIDNLAKAVFDALTDMGVWKDDSQIVFTLINKKYSAWATGVWIHIETHEKHDNGNTKQ